MSTANIIRKMVAAMDVLAKALERGARTTYTVHPRIVRQLERYYGRALTADEIHKALQAAFNGETLPKLDP